MHMLQSLFYLTTALHVSGVTITQLQEHKTCVTTASGVHNNSITHKTNPTKLPTTIKTTQNTRQTRIREQPPRQDQISTSSAHKRT
jgi:hypothetical protein